MPDTIPESILSILRQLGVEYEAVTHASVKTSAESAAAQGVDLNSTCKPMLVRFTRHAKEFYVVITIPGGRKLDLKKVKDVLKADEVALGKLEHVQEITGFPLGAVPPFGHPNKMALLVDLSLLSKPMVAFNAGSNMVSVKLSGKDLRAILKNQGAAGFDVSIDIK